MTPTRLRTLLAFAGVFAALGYAVAASAYTSIPFPGYAPVPLALLAVTDLVLAKIVRDRVRRQAPGAASRPRPARALHPMQVARAAVLAKASSTGGAILLGGYLGLLAWTLPRRDELLTAERAAVISGLAALASLALVLAALLLERSCRTPQQRP